MCGCVGNLLNSMLRVHVRTAMQARRKITRAYMVPRHTDPRLDAGPILIGYLRLVQYYRGFFPALFNNDSGPAYIFTTLNESRSAFTSSPLSAGTVTHRLVTHLTALGTYAGETSHSLKRGGLIASPLSNAELARLPSLTEGTITRYRDVRR
jgi:hypothetical protein